MKLTHMDGPIRGPLRRAERYRDLETWAAGFLYQAVRSKVVRNSTAWATYAVLALAAAPDFVKLEGWRWFILFLFLAFGVEKLKQGIVGAELAGYRASFKQTGDIISSMAATVRGSLENHQRDPDLVIRRLLQEAVSLAEESLSPVAGTRIFAHLLRPVGHESTGEVVGVQWQLSDTWQPARVHADLIALTAPGAGRTFQLVEPQAIPDTERCGNEELRDKEYKSVATFPIVVGEPRAATCAAVLALDATTANVFTHQVVRDLHPFIAPIAQLIGLAFTLQEREGAE